MNVPIVSVIMPVYNCAEYVGDAIESVLIQKVPLELIIIDDCSTDDTKKVFEKYKSCDNIRFLKNDSNRGVAETRNRGVRQAKGKYIAYLDADDCWREDKLEKQLNILENSDTVLCYTGRTLMKSNGEITDNIIHVIKRVDYRTLLRHNCIACSSVMLLKRVAQEIPMCHDRYHEDYINWLRILKKYGTACGIDEPLLLYRMNPRGKSQNKVKSARMTYGVYRTLGIGRVKSLCLVLSHLFHGVIKYLPINIRVGQIHVD